MSELRHRQEKRLKKSPALYIVMLAVWAVLCVALWYYFSRGFASPPFEEGVSPGLALRIAAVVLLVLNAVFISYFWLNGVKDFLYVIWFTLARRKLERGYRRVLAADVSEADDLVLMLYCTCNDFDGDSLERCMRQSYRNCSTVILDDSTQEEYKAAVDAFAARHHLRVVRRADRKGFKAGNINNFLLSDEVKASGYRYAVILDSDEVIPPDFIRECLRYFAAYDNVGIVQANHIATRNRNFFMKLFHIGVNSHWPTYQMMKHRYGFSSMLGHGAMIRRDCYEAAGGFPHLVAEDLCLSIEMRNLGYTVAFAPNIICEEEYPVDYVAFKKRHSKWTQGNLEFIKKYTGKIARADMRWFEKLDIVLFTYNLPLTAIFALYILLNIVLLPVMGVEIGRVYPLWMLVPTIVFFFSPMLNDVFTWLLRINIFRFLFYQLCVIVLYGSMFFTSLVSALLGMLGKRAQFIVTPENSHRMTFVHALRVQWKELAFSTAFIAVSLIFIRSFWPVFLIAMTGYLSFFLLFFANYRYAPGEADDIDRETAAVTLDQNGLLGRRRLKKTALPAN